jgi:tetratricopeptide (TPR) repeat protein
MSLNHLSQNWGQVQELFQLGQERFRKGLLDKALKAYLQAERKNEVDFPLQLQIGKSYLYGIDEDDNVIDLPEAERHLLLAARYADAEKGTFPQWNEYCGQAYFHAAIAACLIGEQEQAAGRPDSTRACLKRALSYLAKAAVLWPDFTEIVYTQAKCHALLGQTPDAIQKLELLSDRDRRYFAKAAQDGDFRSHSSRY